MDTEAGDDALIEALSASARELDTARAELRSMRASAREEHISALVDAGMDEGKISPAMRQSALALCAMSPAAFADFLDAMPPLISTVPDICPVLDLRCWPPGRRGDTALTDQQTAICSALV